MTTDTAAVALAEAMEAVSAERTKPENVIKNICNNLSAKEMIAECAIALAAELDKRGIYLQSWNTDMSQAPRDGTPILIAEFSEITKKWRFEIVSWKEDYHTKETCFSSMRGDDFSIGCYFMPYRNAQAWCHLMPPPKVGV